MARTSTKNSAKTDIRDTRPEEISLEAQEALEDENSNPAERYGGKKTNAEAYTAKIRNKQGYERGKLVSPEANDSL